MVARTYCRLILKYQFPNNYVRVTRDDHSATSLRDEKEEVSVTLRKPLLTLPPGVPIRTRPAPRSISRYLAYGEILGY